MIRDIATPHPPLPSARDLLKWFIQDDKHLSEPPELMTAIAWANELHKESGLYVKPEFLYEVWQEMRKEMK